MDQIKTRKIAELAFHKNTGEPEAIAAFLALRRVGTGIEDLLNDSSSSDELTQVSSWTISGPDSHIMKCAFMGCLLAKELDGKCHIEYGKKTYFKQKFTITLKYSNEYICKAIEEQFEKMIK